MSVAAHRGVVVKVVAVIGWLAFIAVGYGALFAFSTDAGRAADAPVAWPSDTSLGSAGPRPRLIVFAHPRCPCTQATMAEIARLMARLDGALDADVVFFDEGAEATEMWRRAGEIPGVRTRVDRAQQLADRFRVHTSGQALLYDAGGALRFAGGITPSRGHEGDSVGRERVIELVETGATERAVAAVFGCSLDDADVAGFVARGLRSWF